MQYALRQFLLNASVSSFATWPDRHHCRVGLLQDRRVGIGLHGHDVTRRPSCPSVHGVAANAQRDVEIRRDALAVMPTTATRRWCSRPALRAPRPTPRQRFRQRFRRFDVAHLPPDRHDLPGDFQLGLRQREFTGRCFDRAPDVLKVDFKSAPPRHSVRHRDTARRRCPAAPWQVRSAPRQWSSLVVFAVISRAPPDEAAIEVVDLQHQPRA